MTELIAKGAIIMQENLTKSKRGIRHSKNPFIGAAVANTKTGVKKITSSKGEKMMMINETTGEYVAPAGFWHTEEVDKSKFVKLFINGVKAFKDLTSAGTKVFELLYLCVQENINKDEIWLTFPAIDQEITPIGETTFYRGMKELLIKDFIAESEIPGKYFLNPDYLWNGDRLAFVREYRKASSTPKKPADVAAREELEARGQERLVE